MPSSQKLERLCVHKSVENVVPQDAFVEAFDDISLQTELVGDGEAYDEADAVASYVPRPEFLDAAWVHCIRAGYDAFDMDAYRSAGVPITNSTGIHGTTVSEVALGYMLSFARLFHVYRDQQNETNWYAPEYDRPFTVENERVCVLGLGTIGKGVAKRADALGMDVVGVRRSNEPVAGISSLYQPDELHEAITDARFVVVTIPHTPQTDGMISDPEFERMRTDAYLINVARGPIVDEGALVAALQSGEIAGTGLDVFEKEPLPEESPLWDMEEVIITPHKGSATNRYHLDLAELTKENLRRLQAGDSLKNRVA
jgi:D-2-hydroxyacid dehydrogenase (NADP+)